MPYNDDCYGFLHSLQIKPNTKYKNFYYLLNWSNKETKDLFDFYFNYNKTNTEKLKREDENKIIKKRLEIKKDIEERKEKLLDLSTKYDDNDEVINKYILMFISVNDLSTKLNTHIIQRRTQIPKPDYLYNNDDKNEIVNLVMYYQKIGYSIFDIIIRTTINITLSKLYIIGKIDYMILWELLKKHTLIN